MGLVLKYGSEKDAIKYLPPENQSGLEFWITNKIRELKDAGDKTKHKLGVLSGHEEIKLSDANLVALKDQLKAASGGREVDLDVKVDPSIIGGLIVKLGSRMVDGSLKTKLNAIRLAMKEVG